MFLLQAGPNPSFSLFIMIGMFVVMYFFLIRPQAKRAKDQKSFEQSIAAGETIVTTSGIHGTIKSINDDGTLQVEIARGVFIKVERSAVSRDLTSAQRTKTEKALTAATS